MTFAKKFVISVIIGVIFGFIGAILSILFFDIDSYILLVAAAGFAVVFSDYFIRMIETKKKKDNERIN